VSARATLPGSAAGAAFTMRVLRQWMRRSGCTALAGRRVGVIYSRPMRPLIVKQLNYDLTPVAGLALVGHHLKRLAPVFKQIDKPLPVRTGVCNSDIVRSYVGLLVQGKSDSTPSRTP
jgi:hypothetical protein